MSRKAVLARLRSDVKTFGWHCISVHPCEGEEGSHFTYTIGLTETFGHSEIIIFDLDSQTSHGVLSDCVRKIRAGTVFCPDIEYPDVVGGGYSVVFRRVRAACLPEHFGAAVHFYGGRQFNALVLFWPNKAHQFPWQVADPPVQKEALDIIEP